MLVKEAIGSQFVANSCDIFTDIFRVASPHAYDYFSASEVALEVYEQEMQWSNLNKLTPRQNGRHFADKTRSNAFFLKWR